MYSVAQITQEMHIKDTERYYSTPIRAFWERKTKELVWIDKKRTHAFGWEYKLVQPLWEVMELPQEVEIWAL